MADDRHYIDDIKYSAGRQILSMMDDVGFDPYAAGWIHDRPTRTWRYLLSTPMLKTKGSIWIYQRFMKLFANTPLPVGVSPLDIFVIDPDLEVSIFGQSLLGSDSILEDGYPIGKLHFGINQELVFESFKVTDGFAKFYRRLDATERRKRRDPARSFNHKVSKLKAA